MPSSRAKAYHMRAIDVTEATPHNHMATPMTMAMALAKSGVRLLDTM
jgi:hypothetical protein